MAIADNEMRDTDSSKEGGAWGTLEELLLACAVSRHGTESWDSIAMEVLKRTTTSPKSTHNNFLKVFTPHNCEQRYHALKRRFDVNTDAGKADGENDVVGQRDLREEKLPFMIDELRKLRVEELRREVERRDVSIVSLQLKVKRLEEGEKSSFKAEDEADLVPIPDRSDAGDERRGREAGGYSPEEADKSVFKGPSDEPEGRSFNESNSYNRIMKPNVKRNLEPDPVLSVGKSEPDKYALSSRGMAGRTFQAVQLGDPGELGGSVSESKKQSNDVQRSASLPRRKRRRWRRRNGVGSSSSDEIEVEKELSPANKRMNVKSQPLFKFLEMVRSHKHGLVFHRRLPSQDTYKYKNLIRQHMDLETVESKLERGIYCNCHPRFYRDLLLIFTNAVLFFRKSSSEHLAARELRRVITTEIVSQQLARNPKKPTFLVKPVLESRRLDLVTKSKNGPTSSNIVVCRRRRNSSSMKTSEEEKKSLMEAEAGKSNHQGDLRKKGSNAKDEPMKLKRERLNLSGKSKGTVEGKVQENDKNDKDESWDEEDEPINKRRQIVSSKKEGVVNFLKRMKQNSPPKELEPNVDDTEGGTTEIMDLNKKKGVFVDGMEKKRASVRRSETIKRGGGRSKKRGEGASTHAKKKLGK